MFLICIVRETMIVCRRCLRRCCSHAGSHHIPKVLTINQHLRAYQTPSGIPSSHSRHGDMPHGLPVFSQQNKWISGDFKTHLSKLLNSCSTLNTSWTPPVFFHVHFDLTKMRTINKYSNAHTKSLCVSCLRFGGNQFPNQ